jgi:hypothetical protein
MEKIPVLRVRPFFTEEKEEGLRFGRIHVSEDFPDAAGDHRVNPGVNNQEKMTSRQNLRIGEYAWPGNVRSGCIPKFC